jgi:precorrin-4/cobalt-precorrin-4 C11-methyltransferase
MATGPLGRVWFVGAGPGAADLITVRGMRLLQQADLVVYADSLVDPELCRYARPEAEIVPSSGLTLEETTQRLVQAAREGKQVVRLQSGDPSIYGAVHEQMARLDAAGVQWTIVPGVSSGFAAAAALGVELTVPEVAQTVIMSRISGKASPVPEGESLHSLASHQASLVLFLSVPHISRVVSELLAGGYPLDTPVAVVYRVSWPDEDAVVGTLADIREAIRPKQWTRQALILVGRALNRASHERRRSRLYSADHGHIFREARVSEPLP